MKLVKVLAAVLLAVFPLLGLIPVPGLNTAMALRGATVAVYNGRGAWAESVVAFERFLDWKGISWEEVRARDINSNDLRPLYRALFMPGGYAAEYNKGFNGRGLQNIRDFVAGGGGYIGACAGAYFASNYNVSEGMTYDYPLDLFKGYVMGANDEIAPGDLWVMALLRMNKENIINTYEPSTGFMLYYGGPTFYPDPDQPVDILATYDVSGEPAAVNFRYGEGRVVLLGTHPEIEEDDSGVPNIFQPGFNDYGSDWPFLWAAMDWLFGETITRPPFSGDAVAPVVSSVSPGARRLSPGTPLEIAARVTDNDAVKRVTVTVQGNKYRMAPRTATSVLLHESLKTGSFNVDAAGSGGNPRGGGRPGSGGMAYFERSLNTAGYRDIEIMYRRPAAGPEEFRLEWSDGTKWNYLERPSGEISDGPPAPGEVFRRFRLPGVASGNPALKISLGVWSPLLLRWDGASHITVMGKSSQWDYSFDTSNMPPGTYSYTVTALDHAGNQSTPVNGQFVIR
ncbi:MAG: hypothetical protein HY673_16000 [Chloroflexi bacterium]|nr:hypothetical protein [Chloroflexota bacterium]